MEFISRLLIRYYAFWAIPLAFLCFEWAVHKCEENTQELAIISFGSAGLLTLGSIFWFIVGGYGRADVWVYSLF